MNAFFDTNVLIYAFGNDPRRAVALDLLADGGTISTQVLNEFAAASRRKEGRSWVEIERAVTIICEQIGTILPLTAETNAAAMALAREHGFSFNNALIVAAALQGKCDALYSEDLQDGRTIDGLTIVNPFME